MRSQFLKREERKDALKRLMLVKWKVKSKGWKWFSEIIVEE